MTKRGITALAIVFAFVAGCFILAYLERPEEIKASLEIEVYDGRMNRTYYTNTFKFSDPMIIFTDIYGVTRAVPIYSVVEIEDR